MRAKYSRITEEIKQAVCRDYLRGDKVLIITMEHGVDSSSMYRILDEKKITLRRDDLKVTKKNTDQPPEIAPQGGLMSSIDPKAERERAEEVMERIKKSWRPGDFFLTITPEDLHGLDDSDFVMVWDVLGMIIKNRQKRKKGGKRLKTKL